MLKKPATLLFLLLATAGLAHADAYKCRTADGRIEITSVPCTAGSSTVKSQPAEKVSEVERLRVEKEVERMREYVERRENTQRTETGNDAGQANRQAAPARQPAAAPLPAFSPLYGNAEECLRNVAQMVLEASQRTQMENDCRQLQPPPPIIATPVANTTVVPYPVPVPVRSNGQVISNMPQQQNHATVISSTPGAARATQEPQPSQVLMPRLKKQQQP